MPARFTLVAMFKKSLVLVFSALVLASCSSADDSASSPVTSTLVVDQDGNPVTEDNQQPSPTLSENDTAAESPSPTADTNAAQPDSTGFDSYTRVDMDSFADGGFLLADGETACNTLGAGISCTKVVGGPQNQNGLYFGYKTDKPTVLWNPTQPGGNIY